MDNLPGTAFVGDRYVDNGTRVPTGGGTNGIPGTWTLTSTTGTTIPEPVALVIFGFGLAGLCLTRRPRLA